MEVQTFNLNGRMLDLEFRLDTCDRFLQHRLFICLIVDEEMAAERVHTGGNDPNMQVMDIAYAIY